MSHAIRVEKILAIFIEKSADIFKAKKNDRVVLITTKASKIYTEFKFRSNDTLLFGRESAGVPNEIHKIVDEQLTIPMKKGMRSINVSSAVAIVASEACRQIKLF